MTRRKNNIDKKAKKKGRGKCRFCPCDTYELLDLHRITEGNEGGIYSDQNTVVVCANCHRKIHAGIIKIDRQYSTMSGRWCLHYWIDDEEYWSVDDR
jgi:hypothetical protein